MGRSDIIDVAIRGPNWIGDAVLTNVVLDYLTHRLPSARLHLWTRPHLIPLYRLRSGGRSRGHGPPPRFHPLPDPHRRCAMPAAARAMRRIRPAAILLLAPSLRAGLEAALAGIPVRLGYPTDYRGPLLTHPVRRNMPRRTRWSPLFPCHMLDAWLDMARALADIVAPQPRPDGRAASPPLFDATGAFTRTWVFPESLALEVSTLIPDDPNSRRPRVVLAPFVGSGTARAWPPTRYGDLATMLLARLGADVFILGGPKDTSTSLGRPRENADAPERLHLLVGRNHLPLDRVAALLAQADVLVSNDSGLMHLAASLDTPVVALFGPTLPSLTGPYALTARGGIPHRLLRRDDLLCLGCYRRHCPSHHECLDPLTVDEVASAVAGVLEEVRRGAPSVRRCSKGTG